MSLLESVGLCAGYGRQQVVRSVDLSVGPAQIVVLLGPNGAGKTTTLLTLAGVLPALAGTVTVDGHPAQNGLHRRARAGLGLVPDERSIFRALTVRENLRLGRGDVDAALGLFPELVAKLATRAGLLSGGEQQMLALSVALSRRPKVLLVDELSLGLAPLAVDRLLRALRTAADDGLGVLLVEQHVTKVLGVADQAYVMRRGSIVLSGGPDTIRERLDEVEAAYLSAAP